MNMTWAILLIMVYYMMTKKCIVIHEAMIPMNSRQGSMLGSSTGLHQKEC